ncbi:hypothetical protein E0H75_25700 [Kribbella capetownensis]|uniref:Septum formation-related domain-containing protein n=1 Tax=Kribbella capetownensis TaxID=1572659 RepID=A0A4V6N4G7_9ACTN|nr:DUF4190 domain-containing protein [Kribbella capetownensis]TCC46472.1 hypothetical protein E0H75_25700 [Kribbella capetownensis]
MSHPKFPEYSARPPAETPESGPPPRDQRATSEPGPPPFPNMPPVSAGLRPTNRKAVLSLVLAIVGLVPVSIPLGIKAMDQARKRGEQGARIAITGFVIAAVWMSVDLKILNHFLDRIDPDSAAHTAREPVTPGSKLEVGDCVGELPQGEIKDVAVKPCDQPNGGRVFARFAMPDGSWLGDEVMRKPAEAGCWNRWIASKEQVNTPSRVFVVRPSQDSWQKGDRTVTCLLVGQ